MGGWNPDVFDGQPFTDLPPEIPHGRRLGHSARIGKDAEKGKETRPRKPNRAVPVELTIQPRSRRLVLWHGCRMGIDEQVGIHQNHLKPSLSTISRTSAILSKLPVRGRP